MDIGDLIWIEGELERDYLRYWAARLGVTDELERVLADPPLGRAHQ